MKYKAYIRQDGEGCDYTIGCGRNVIHLTSSNMKDAIQELLTEIKENYIGEQSLEYCEIFEVNDTFICNLDEIYENIDKEYDAYQQRMIDDKEREEYERLKSKFETVK